MAQIRTHEVAASTDVQQFVQNLKQKYPEGARSTDLANFIKSAEIMQQLTEELEHAIFPHGYNGAKPKKLPDEQAAPYLLRLIKARDLTDQLILFGPRSVEDTATCLALLLEPFLKLAGHQTPGRGDYGKVVFTPEGMDRMVLLSSTRLMLSTASALMKAPCQQLPDNDPLTICKALVTYHIDPEREQQPGIPPILSAILTALEAIDRDPWKQLGFEQFLEQNDAGMTYAEVAAHCKAAAIHCLMRATPQDNVRVMLQRRATARALASSVLALRPNHPAAYYMSQFLATDGLDMEKAGELSRRGIEVADAGRYDYYSALLRYEYAYIIPTGAVGRTYTLREFDHVMTGADMYRKKVHKWLPPAIFANIATARQRANNWFEQAMRPPFQDKKYWDLALEAQKLSRTDEAHMQQDHATLSVDRCSNCSSQLQGLKACANCKQAWYCSRDCQRAHWPQHKAPCKAAQEAAAAADAKQPADNGAAGASQLGPITDTYEQLLQRRPRELKEMLTMRGVDCSDCLEKEDLAKRIVERCSPR